MQQSAPLKSHRVQYRRHTVVVPPVDQSLHRLRLLPTAALGYDHVLVLELVGDNALFVSIQQRDGFESRGDAAGGTRSLRVGCVEKTFDGRVLRRRQT